MQIAKHAVVSFDYTLTGPDGQVIDSSEGAQPLTYLHGMGHIIPGLERELEGKQSGDAMNVTIQPGDGYGQRSDQLVQEVSRDAFKGVTKIEPGTQFQANTPEGPRVVTVTKVSDTTVTVDANHPLAGVPLNFDVKVVEVRAATPEEIQHGHVHGPGGHQH